MGVSALEQLAQDMPSLPGMAAPFITPPPEDGARFGFGAADIDGHLGGLMRGTLHEVRCAQTRGIGIATGLVLGLLARLERSDRRIVWVADPAAEPEAGCLYPDGLAQLGFDPARLIVVTPKDMKDALWAGDQAAGCEDIAALVLHIAGNPGKLDLTATRRLMLRARESRVTVLILRQGGEGEPSAAATRWEVAPLPSLSNEAFREGIGQPALSARLERNRNGRNGAWRLAFDPERKGFLHVPEPSTAPEATAADRVDLPAASGKRPDRPAEMGQVMAFERAS